MAFLAGLLALVLAILTIAGAWRGLRKAGFSGAWSLLLIVPMVNLVALWIFAFISWPVDDPNRPLIEHRD